MGFLGLLPCATDSGVNREVTCISSAWCFGESIRASAFLGPSLGGLGWVDMRGASLFPQTGSGALITPTYPSTPLTTVAGLLFAACLPLAQKH